MRFTAACVQIQGSSDIERNLKTTRRLICEAADLGASLVVTPEATNFLGPHSRKLEIAEKIDGKTPEMFAELARERSIHLMVGSFVERGDDRRVYNTSLLFGPDGELIAHYRKLHLFDVAVPNGVTFHESETTIPGDEVVVADTALGKIGMTICYDLRFGELYRALVEKGAEIITVPSAFTLMTGKDHWSVLLRARAIESQAWVIAPGQWGEHDDEGLRRSYGHSLIVDPWGVVTAQCGDREGICLSPVDLEVGRRLRQNMPVGQHRRL